MKRNWLVVAAMAGVAVLVRCSPPTAMDPVVSLSARPRSIANNGAMSTITVTATDAEGKPGTGMVRLTSTAGSLSAGMDVELLLGSNDVSFACPLATDPMCMGNVRITASWMHAGKAIEGSLSITVTTPDAGGGTGGGSGGGTGGSGGSSGGSTGGGTGTAGGSTAGGAGDGGVTTTHRLVLTSPKPSLVRGTGDSLNLRGVLTLTATGAPVANTMVNLTTTGGSFAAAPGTLMTSVMTDAMGVVTVPFFIAGSPDPSALITATGLTAMATVRIYFVSVANLLWEPDSRTKAALGVQFSNRDLSTPVYFKVVDTSSRGVGGVELSFTATGPLGLAINPTSVTDDGGIAFTTLTSGNDTGIATVNAAVTATIGTGSELRATRDIPIVAGKPNGGGFVLTCARKNLGALHTPSGVVPPTRTPAVTTDCTATLSDRFGIKIGLATPVQFFAEKGNFAVPMASTSTQAGVNLGVATNSYSSASNELPLDVPPVVGEPSYAGGRNPRDMVVAIIAIANGEEQFYDGSADGGANGRWDPGEWFVDQSEPFVDSNDNGTWDPGETWINNATDCARPDGGLNAGWDGPNGCWDSDTQLWETTHVVWTGALTQTVQFTPPGPWTVMRGATFPANFSWRDAWGNPLSIDSPGINATLIGMNLGGATITTNGLTGDQLGNVLLQPGKVEATETAPGSGIFNVIGPCNGTLPGPMTALTRCIRRITITGFGNGNSGTVTFTGRNVTPLPDGGPPPSSGSLRMTTSHQFSTSAFQDFPVTFE